MGERLADRVCVVTGGGRNIGRAMSRRFAAEGAKVAVVDLDEDRGQAVTEEILDAEGPDTALFVRADVTDEAAVRSMVERVSDEWGRVDGLVNNVAYAANKDVLECTLADWQRVIDVTLTSAFLCTKYVAPVARDAGGGAIVNVGSTSAHRGTPQKVAYCAAKAGLLNFTRQTAVDLASHDIRVNMLSPTRTGAALGYEEGGPGRHTKGILRGRLGEPDDQAGGALYLLSDEADFVTGTELVVDGGTLASF